MTDSRSAAVVSGAVVVVLALFAPWYAIDLGGAARGALAQQTGQLPPVLAELARSVLAVLPDRAALAGAGAGLTTLVVMMHRPGPGNDLVAVHLQWGAWVA